MAAPRTLADVLRTGPNRELVAMAAQSALRWEADVEGAAEKAAFDGALAEALAWAEREGETLRPTLEALVSTNKEVVRRIARAVCEWKAVRVAAAAAADGGRQAEEQARSRAAERDDTRLDAAPLEASEGVALAWTGAEASLAAAAGDLQRLARELTQ